MCNQMLNKAPNLSDIGACSNNFSRFSTEKNDDFWQKND